MTELLAFVAVCLLAGIAGMLVVGAGATAGMLVRKRLSGGPGRPPLLGDGTGAGGSPDASAEGHVSVRDAARLAERRRTDPFLRGQAEGLSRACDGHRMATERTLPLLDEAFEPGSLSWERFHAPVVSAVMEIEKDISDSYGLLSKMDSTRIAWLMRKRDDGTISKDQSLASELAGIEGDMRAIDGMMDDAAALVSSISSLTDGLDATVAGFRDRGDDGALADEIATLASRLPEY